MDDSDFARTPNPFSPFTNAASRPSRAVSTIKLLLTAIVLLVITTAGQNMLGRLRVEELLNGFSLDSTPKKIDRLNEMHSHGDRGLPGIVIALTDEQPEVAQVASEMISDMTRQWTALPQTEQAENHLLLADSLDRVSRSIRHTRDPKWQRVYRVAQATSQKLIESPDGIHQPAYTVLMRIVNREADLAGGDSEAPETDPMIQPSASKATIADAPESWTDWPPRSDEESSAPSLYRRSVATLSADKPSQILLSQATVDGSKAEDQPQLLRPHVGPASTLVEQSRQEDVIDTNETAYWVDQLASPSPFVRMRAVTELGRRDEPSARSALEKRLREESNAQVVTLIESHLRDARIANATKVTR